MKIAIGMIVRNLISVHPLTDFLDNAEKYDHPIERVIVVYSHEADPEAIQELQRKAKVSLIRLQNYERAHMVLKQPVALLSSASADRTQIYNSKAQKPRKISIFRGFLIPFSSDCF